MMSGTTSNEQRRDDTLIANASELVTVEGIVAWCVAEDLPIGDIVAMDEFDHDLPVLLPGGSVLVFGCT